MDVAGDGDANGGGTTERLSMLMTLMGCGPWLGALGRDQVTRLVLDGLAPGAQCRLAHTGLRFDAKDAVRIQSDAALIAVMTGSDATTLWMFMVGLGVCCERTAVRPYALLPWMFMVLCVMLGPFPRRGERYGGVLPTRSLRECVGSTNLRPLQGRFRGG